ncbi:TerD family protein [Clostridiaceae bacterium M8S5]|nr:TerD family protein [Clostridiaceae bacterium M8S5]
MKIKIEKGTKQGRKIYNNNKVKVNFGDSVIHEGKIDLRQGARAIQKGIANTQGSGLKQAPLDNNNVIKATAGEVKPQPAKIKKPNNIIDKSKSVNVKKGQKVSITKNVSNISRVLVALEWEYKSQSFDIDTSIFMMDVNNKTAEEDFIFYNNPISRSNAVALKKDFNKKLLDCYDITLQLNLNTVPSNIKVLAVTVTVDEEAKNKHSFKDIKNAQLKIIDVDTNKEIFSYSFAQGLTNQTAIVASEIYKHGDEWKINCIGSGFTGGLQALCDNYGIDTK